MNDSADITMILRKVMTALVITFTGLLLIAAVMFLLNANLEFIFQLITVTIAATVLTALSFWSPGIKTVASKHYQLVMFSMLLIAYVISVVVAALLIFQIGPMYKLLVLLLVAQLIHLAVYGLHWFFFEESNSETHKSLTAEEISQLEVFDKPGLQPRYQSESGNGH